MNLRTVPQKGPGGVKIMCRFCANLDRRSHPDFLVAHLASMATDKGTHAMLLYSSALVALAGAFDGGTCRALKRRSFESLVKISTNFLAEFKSASDSDDSDHLTVTIHRKHLLFELFRRARDILTTVRDAHSNSDVEWALERSDHLAKAILNLVGVTNGTEWDFKEAEGTVTALAGLVTELCEWQMERTGEGPPNWPSDSSASRADRLAMSLYDVAEQLAIKRQKRFPES